MFELVQLIDVIEDGGELLLHPGEVGVGQFEPGELGHLADLVEGQRHDSSVPGRKLESRQVEDGVFDFTTADFVTWRACERQTFTFSNGFTLTGLTTSPLRMAEADTHTFFTTPSTTHGPSAGSA